MRTVWMLGLAALAACATENNINDLNLVGGDGALRFNLVFTNESEVDLDLYVLTPEGNQLWYAELEDPSGGQLDVDCLCGDCPQGPNENVFWDNTAAAPAGTYEIWVEYYGPCDLDLFDPNQPVSDYTLRVLEGGEVMATHEGTLRAFAERDVYTYVYEP